MTYLYKSLPHYKHDVSPCSTDPSCLRVRCVTFSRKSTHDKKTYLSAEQVEARWSRKRVKKGAEIATRLTTPPRAEAPTLEAQRTLLYVLYSLCFIVAMHSWCRSWPKCTVTDESFWVSCKLKAVPSTSSDASWFRASVSPCTLIKQCYCSRASRVPLAVLGACP